jgi:hypothetical protein
MSSNEPVVEAVRLLRPESGDIVFLHLRDRLTMREFDEFKQSLAPIAEQHPDVSFMALERVDEVTTLRMPLVAYTPQELERRRIAAEEAALQCATARAGQEVGRATPFMIAAAVSAWLEGSDEGREEQRAKRAKALPTDVRRPTEEGGWDGLR